MEEKNKASEMLHQIKKYIRVSGAPEKVTPVSEQVTDDEPTDTRPAAAEPVQTTPAAIAEEEPTDVAEAVAEEPVIEAEKLPVQPKKEKTRRLPVDEALFEFDEIAFDDVLVPEPEPLTPEQAVYADEIREKFGVSSNVGIAFISEAPTESKTSFAPPENESEVTESSEAVESFEEFKAEEIIAEESFEESEAEEIKAEETDESLGAVTDEAFYEDVSEESFGESDDENAVVTESATEEIRVIPTEGDEPEQVVFGIEDDIPEEKPAYIRSENYTSSGVQLTFLDAEDDYYGDEPEQIGFEEAVTGSEQDGGEELDIFEETEEAEAEPSVYEYETEQSFEDGVAEQLSEPVVEEAFEPVASITEDELEAAEAEPEKEGDEPLTALEINAIEQEELMADQEQAVETVTEAEPSNDIWDDADRPLYEAKKKYMDFCEGLIVPPLRTSKESPVAPVTETPASSEYRYAAPERLPLFADGKNGGKNTEGYKNREMEYCREREEKRSAQMLERLRVSGRRLMFCALIMLAVIITENIGVFFAANPDALLSATGPMLFGIINAVLLIIGSIMVFDSLGIGIKRMLGGVFTLESLTACTVLPAIIYHIVIAFAGDRSEFTMLFGTAAAISVFLTALYKYNTVKRDYATFTVTASYGDYLTESEVADYINTPEGEAFGDYMDEEASLYRLNSIARIDAPYTEKPVTDECFGLIRKLVLCIISVSVIAGVVFGILHHDAVYGVLSAISLISFACPVSSFIAVSLPRLRASTVAGESGGAIACVDDEDDYDESVIMLEDGDLFPASYLSSSNFEIYSSSVEAHLARTLALFKKIGGPIAVVFNNVEGTVDNFESVRITEITEQGIQARIDGRPICAGSESFMSRMGINISRYDKLLPKNGRVMYIADDGVFFARLILVFKSDSELVKKIAELRNTNTVFSLKTCNPCIDKELLFYTTGLEPELLRLVKYKVGDDTATAKTDREGGLISNSGAKGLLTALLEYKRQKALVRNASVFACIACVIGAFVSLLTSAIKINFGFSSLVALALHGGLSLVAFLISSRKGIDTKTKIKKK